MVKHLIRFIKINANFGHFLIDCTLCLELRRVSQTMIVWCLIRLNLSPVRWSSWRMMQDTIGISKSRLATKDTVIFTLTYLSFIRDLTEKRLTQIKVESILLARLNCESTWMTRISQMKFWKVLPKNVLTSIFLPEWSHKRFLHHVFLLKPIGRDLYIVLWNTLKE